MGKILVITSFFCLLAAAVHAWPHGSVASCPAGKEPECPLISSGIHDIKLPHPTDCHYFIHCDAGGLPICKECPAELHFNNTSKDCDWPHSAGCEITPTEPSITTEATDPPTPSPTRPSTTASTSVTTVTTEGPEECTTGHVDCPNCTCDGDREPHPYECEWYYECQDGRYHLHKCEGGWHFNSKELVCDYPCNAGCEDSTGPGVTTPIPTVSTTESGGSGGGGCPSTGGKSIPKCPSIQPSYEVYYQHPTDCGWYFQCSNGTPYCMPCPAGLHWNVRKEICDWPNLAKCVI